MLYELFDGKQIDSLPPALVSTRFFDLKNVLVKAENIQDNGDQFGVFMVYITENQLNKLKENNTESSLFMDLEVMSTESERWNIFQK